MLQYWKGNAVIFHHNLEIKQIITLKFPYFLFSTTDCIHLIIKIYLKFIFLEDFIEKNYLKYTGLSWITLNKDENNEHPKEMIEKD